MPGKVDARRIAGTEKKGSDMKKWTAVGFCVVLMVAFLSACGGDKEEIQRKFLDLTGEKATNQTVVAVHDFVRENLPKLNQEEASHMLMAYEDYLIGYINVDSDQSLPTLLEPYYDTDEKKIDSDQIQNQETKKIYDNLKKADIRCSVQAGQFILSVNHKAMLNEFGKDITPALSRLYKLKEVEFSRPAAENAVLKITWGQLADRAYSVEKMIKKYKEDDDLIREDAQWMYENYMSMMLMGLNNSPIFDFKTGEFSKEANDAYTKFIAEHPKSLTAGMLKQYFSYLNEIDYRMNYKNKTQSKQFFDQCGRLVSEAGKRVFE